MLILFYFWLIFASAIVPNNELTLLFMEIRLFRSLEDMSKGKHFLCVRVENPDCFEFDKTLSVFRTLYGTNIVVVVIAA